VFFLRKPLLAPRLGCVLVTNGCHQAELHGASKHAGSNVRTSRMVAEIFGEQFFAPVWSLEARPDRYLRNRESPQPHTCIIGCADRLCASLRASE
jgi:hypothetical protein